MQFGYVSPEQFYKDKADYARKGIARGRSVIVMQYEHGILFVAENLSRSLHKISEIYDRIAFAAAGRYPELESLRIAGVRLADLRGYSFDRADVNGRALANTYAQTLDAIFTTQPKPYEVEIAVAEVGDSAADDQIYRLTYEGSVVDEHGFAVMGGAADLVSRHLSENYREAMSFDDAARLAVAALGRDNASGEVRRLTTEALEVALLDRNRPRRKFKRITPARLQELLGNGQGAASATPASPEGESGPQDGTSTGGTTEEPPTA